MVFSAELFRIIFRTHQPRTGLSHSDPTGLLKPRLERRIPNISLSIIPRSRAPINAAPCIEYLYAGGTRDKSLASTCALDFARLSIYVADRLAIRKYGHDPAQSRESSTRGPGLLRPK